MPLALPLRRALSAPFHSLFTTQRESHTPLALALSPPPRPCQSPPSWPPTAASCVPVREVCVRAERGISAALLLAPPARLSTCSPSLSSSSLPRRRPRLGRRPRRDPVALPSVVVGPSIRHPCPRRRLGRGGRLPGGPRRAGRAQRAGQLCCEPRTPPRGRGNAGGAPGGGGGGGGRGGGAARRGVWRWTFVERKREAKRKAG